MTLLLLAALLAGGLTLFDQALRWVLIVTLVAIVLSTLVGHRRSL